MSLAFCCVAAMGGMTGVAHADPTVTIVPPAGSVPLPALNEIQGAGFATESETPTIGVEGNDGSEIDCRIDSPDAPTDPCGPGLPGCQAQLCGSFTPAAPGGEHFMRAELKDSDGYAAADATMRFIVDTTPPNTKALSVQVNPSSGRVLASAESDDDNLIQYDRFECSLEPVGVDPSWSNCPRDQNENFQLSQSVPRSHRDWRFSARTVDLFGRADPTPAAREFDPVPCAVTVHSVSLRTVAARGLPVHADCSYIHRIVLDMHVLAVDGHKRVSTGAALSEGVTVAYKTVHNPGAHFSVNARLRPVRPIRRDLARRRSAVVLIRAAADRPTADGNGSVSGYVIRTLRR